MNRFIRNAVVIGVVIFGIVAAVEPGRVAAADENQAVLAADTAFLQAIAKGDKAALGKLLEPDFLWVDTDANQYNRGQVLQNLPRLAKADVEPSVKLYGDAGVVKAIRGQADANDNGWVELGEIVSYLREQVPKGAAELKKEQMPVVSPDVDPSGPIGTYPLSKARRRG